MPAAGSCFTVNRLMLFMARNTLQCKYGATPGVVLASRWAESFGPRVIDTQHTHNTLISV